MRFLLWVFCIVTLSGPALARCEGTDLIAQLPPETRQTLDDAVAQTPYPAGLLWRARKGDTTLHIFGTYHFRHDQTDAHAAALIPLIEAADTAYFEVNTEDRAKALEAFAREPDLMFITQGPTMPDLLGDPDWSIYSAQMQARGFPGFMAAKFKPLWASMMLGIGPCQARQGAMRAEGVDIVLAKTAQVFGVPDVSLEDFRTIMTLMDDYTMDDQIDMLRMSMDMAQDADNLQHTLLERYLAGEISLMWEYTRLLSAQNGGPNGAEDFREFETALLDKRNLAWIDKLLDEAIGKTSFVAVGAAHLPGKNGVLNLLAGHGFAITPLPFQP